MKNEDTDQSELHAEEMSIEAGDNLRHEPIIVHKLWSDYETETVSYDRRGHGGGDRRMQEKIFKNPQVPDPYQRTATSRDGAMSILIGIAARKSIESGRPVRIAELTDLQPRKKRISAVL